MGHKAIGCIENAGGQNVTFKTLKVAKRFQFSKQQYKTNLC